MMHLTDDEIFELAQLTEDCQPYNSVHLQQMEHLRTCELCYGTFCSALAIMDVTSVCGYMVLSEIYGIDMETEEAFPCKRVLAAVRIIQKKIEQSASGVIKQVEQAGAAFKFISVPSTSIRGVGGTGSEIFKVEDVDDEKTFIVFDAGKMELMVQINRTRLEFGDVKVYICSPNSDTTEVSLQGKGRYLKGILDNIPEEDFEIRIQV